MKKVKTSALVLFLIIGQISFAQDKSYKEIVVENTTAEEDLKVVSDYLDAITDNKMSVASNLLADSFIGTGPSYQETQTKAEVIESWEEYHKVRTNQKNDYLRQTFRVIDGDQKGDWVSIWGMYSYTQNGITVNLPYQFTAQVENGQISRAGIYYDRLAISEAMGLELTPKKE